MVREIAYNEIFDAQQHFRLLLDSMARPGKINQLDGVIVQPPGGLHPASALIGLALLNADVTFHTDGPAIGEYLRLNTASRPADAASADFLFTNGRYEPASLIEAKIGLLTYPETGASVIIDVEAISAEPRAGSLALRLQGPGVDGHAVVFLRGLNKSFLQSIKLKNAEYPLGIDAIFTDPTGHICCMPRSNRFSWSFV